MCMYRTTFIEKYAEWKQSYDEGTIILQMESFP